jgi:hypothetical protein
MIFGYIHNRPKRKVVNCTNQMYKTTLFMIMMLVLGAYGILDVSAHTTNAIINCLTQTPTDRATNTPTLPTSTPTDAATPTYTNTPVTPTDTPTSTNTPDIPTPTNTPITPTSTPMDPTSTPVDPTSTPVDPTNTPVDPTSTPVSPTYTPKTPTATYVLTPTPTETFPSLTLTPTYIPTSTPYPPMPAAAGNDVTVWNSDYIGLLAVGSNSFGLYKGVNAPDGSLYLPSTTHDAALYNGTIWVHRLWKEGWLDIPLGTIVHIQYKDRVMTYAVSDIGFISYGIYPQTTGSGVQYIATCYRNSSGEWAGVELYRIELISTEVENHQK